MQQDTNAGSKRSDATRRALMRAAREEFAEHGLAGARVDRISDAAGVNKERIYGLFGSKDKLFDAVLVDAMQEFTEVADPVAAYADAGYFVATIYDYHRRHPQLLRLLAWEALHRDADPHDVDGWRSEHYRRKIRAAMDEHGTHDRFKAGMATLVLCGIANWINMVPQVRNLLLGEAADDSEAIREYLTTFARRAAGELTAEAEPVNTLIAEGDRVDQAAAKLRVAQAEVEAARAELASRLRSAHREGRSANHLARQVAGTVSRPVVLKLLAEPTQRR